MKNLQKPDLGFYLDLYEALLLPDCVSQSSYFQSQSRKDFLTIKRRSSSSEGYQFCTKTIPKLGKAFDTALVESKFVCPREFKRLRGKSIPVFLQAYFRLVFDCDTGELLPDPPVWAIKHIRQVCFFMYKLEFPYSLDEEKVVIDNFVKTDEELGQIELDDNLDVAIARDMTGGTMYNSTPINIFGAFDPFDIVPKHGPGAVATGEKGEEKWDFTRLYLAIHQLYPYWQYFMLPGTFDSNDPEASLDHFQRIPTGTAKVSLVPKDSRGPRLISAEPLEYMWLQKGLGESIVSHLERTYPTRGQINFTTQSINRYLSLIGSTHKENLSQFGDALRRDISRARMPIPLRGDGTYVTLDLKDASDRVSLALVERIFSKVPVLSQCLSALRTTATRLPDGRQIQLNKYAPMGSALCFPVEAYIFWIIIVAAITRSTSRPPLKIMKEVFVYGDDIIVRKTYSKIAIDALERVGLKVNTQKCCLSGKFRESCGLDAFDGVDVTPLKLRTTWTGNRKDHLALASYISYANSLRDRGYSNLYYHLKQVIESVYGLIPFGDRDASYLCWIVPTREEAHALNRMLFKSTWVARFQAFGFKFRRIIAQKFESKLDGWSRLLRNLTCGPGLDPSSYSLPRRSLIKRGWVIAS